MRVLILGASGLLGFSIYSSLEKKKKFEIFGTFSNIKKKNNFFSKKFILCKNLSNYSELKKIILRVKPNYIINCISSKNIKNIKENIECYYNINKNIFFLHNVLDFFFINISTDGIFNGQKNKEYTENDTCSALDVYGYVKYLSEFKHQRTLNIRTSFFGIDKFNKKKGLYNWLVQNKGKTCYGFSNYIFSPVTNCEIAKFIYYFLNYKMKNNGIINFSGKKISKYHLLKKINDIKKLDILILKKKKKKINRTLSQKNFKKTFNFSIQNIDNMINEIK